MIDTKSMFLHLKAPTEEAVAMLTTFGHTDG